MHNNWEKRNKKSHNFKKNWEKLRFILAKGKIRCMYLNKNWKMYAALTFLMNHNKNTLTLLAITRSQLDPFKIESSSYRNSSKWRNCLKTATPYLLTTQEGQISNNYWKPKYRKTPN